MAGLLARLPNLLTAVRLVLLAPLWALALAGRRAELAAGLLLAGLTDVLDGVLARRSGRATPFGSQLDSLADMLLAGSIVVWLALLRPDFFRAEAPLLLAWVGLGLLALAVGWVRFRRFANLHLYSAKVAGAAGYGFAISLLLVDGYSRPLFLAVLAVCVLASLETLLVFLLREDVDEHLGSILRRPRVRSGT